MKRWFVSFHVLLAMFATASLSILALRCAPPASTGGGSGEADANMDIDNDDADEPVPFTLPLAAELGSFELTEGEVAQNSMAIDMPIDMGPYPAISIDVGATLAAATVTLPEGTNGKLAVAMQEAMMGQTTWCVAAMDSADTACESGDMYGPFDVSLNEDMQPVMTEESTINLTSSSLDLINSGQFSIAIQLLSSIPANVSITQLFVLLTRPTFDTPTGDDCAAPENLAGTYTGTFTCENSCDPPDTGDITLTVTQDGMNASYTDDEGNVFDGTVCGNVFSFTGGDDDETEEGQLTVFEDGSARKVSNWQDINTPLCGGTCTDNLSRVE